MINILFSTVLAMLTLSSVSQASNSDIKLSCDIASCTYSAGQSAKISVKNIPRSNDPAFALTVEGEFAGNAISFSKSGDDYIYTSAIFGADQVIAEVSAKAYLIDTKKEAAIAKSLAEIAQQLIDIDELLSNGTSGDVQLKKQQLLKLQGDLLLKKATTRTLIFSNAVVIETKPVIVPSVAVISLTNLGTSATNKFAPLAVVPKVSVTGGEFSLIPEDFIVFLNGDLLQPTDISISNIEIAILKPAKAGKNAIEFVGYDSTHKLLRGNFEFWAGGQTVVATVKDQSGILVDAGNVRASVVGYTEVFQEQTTGTDGLATFANLPANATILFTAEKSNAVTEKAIQGSEPTISLNLRDFQTETTENLTLVSGLSGWDTTSGTVSIAPRDVDLGIFKSNPIMKMTLVERKKRKPIIRSLSSIKTAQNIPCASGACTLVIQTAGLGSKTTRHTFIATSDNLKIRYRFRTLEVFNGYYGTDYNDIYRITYRTQGGKSGSVTNSMNRIGRGAFAPNSSTDWMELDTDISAGDVVELQAIVKNNGDDLYDSLLQLDFNSQKTFKIEAKFNDDNFTGISVGEHPYLGGKTSFKARVKVTGAPGDQIDSLDLKVRVEGTDLTTYLMSANPSIVNNVLDSTGILESDVEFAIPSTAGLYLPNDAEVNFKLAATSHGVSVSSVPSSTAIVEGKTLPALVSLYANPNHAPGTTPDYSGKGIDWVLPKVKPIVEYFAQIGIPFKEIATMNGGTFDPFILHESGAAVSFAPSWYKLYQDANESAAIANSAARINAAQQIINMIEDPVSGSKIKMICADKRFYKTAGPQVDPFWIKIRENSTATEIVLPSSLFSDKFDLIF